MTNKFPYNQKYKFTIVVDFYMYGGTPKNHKRMPWKVFHQKIKALGGF